MRGIVLACDFGYNAFNGARAIHARPSGQPHISFRQQPVAKPPSGQQNGLSAAVDQLSVLNIQKTIDFVSLHGFDHSQ